MTDQRSFFTTYNSVLPGSWKVNGIGGIQLQVEGTGDIEVESEVDGQQLDIVFRDVLFVPGIGINLFSIGAATKNGSKAEFSDTKVLTT